MDEIGMPQASTETYDAPITHLLAYLVCVDQPGMPAFDSPGGAIHEDLSEALEELRKTRHRWPDAYLASVTYQRCDHAALTPSSHNACVHSAESTHVH